MTDSEAIEELKCDLDHGEFYNPSMEEAAKIAIKALEKVEKIKEVFTHYPFSGFETDVFINCVSALSEIKIILKE